MARLLITTKFNAPQLSRGPVARPRLVQRPRLVERLRRGADARLILVSAPPGFGKTTLAVEWLGQRSDDHRLAWLSLDPADNEPVLFWTYVVTALQRAVPGVGISALELLAAPSVPIEHVLTTVLNELAATPQQLWLVLDDFHLMTDRALNDQLAFLLEHLPAQVHVVLSTRADPDLPLARWRARGELAEIRAADLRFTSAEAEAYLNAVTGLDLTATQVAVLEERTEGWIAALQLAALSLQRRKDTTSFIDRFAGDDRYVVDYLVEEVLSTLPEQIRSFLLQTAVLERLTGPLCDAVTGGQNGREMLTTLERANLFLIALDDQRQWWRYHHLFAEVLRARMLSDHPDQVALLHARASSWYADHDLTEEAVRHALAARDYAGAARLIELAVSEIRRHRREALMYDWLEALPAEVVRSSPVLSVFYGSMLLASGDVPAVEARLDDAERALASVPDGEPPPWADTVDLRTLPATIAIYRASLAQARGDARGTARHAERALELAGEEDHLARGGANGFLGLAAWAQGDVRTALATFGQAVTSLHAAGSLVDELSGTVLIADMELAAGRPSRSRKLLYDALHEAEAQGGAVVRATAELHVGLSELDVEVSDLASAHKHLDAAAALADEVATNESRYRWFVAAGLLARADGDFGAASRRLEQAEQLFRPGFYPEVRPIAAIRARIWIEQSDLAQAESWAAVRGVSAVDAASYLSEFDHLTLVRLLLAQHRAQLSAGALDQADGLLTRLQLAAEASERWGSLLEIRLLQALTLDARDVRPRALESLALALTLAPEPENYVRLFLEEGGPMLSLLRSASDAGLAGDHPQRLLTRSAARTGDAIGPRPTASTADSLSQRELQVLRLLDSELTGPQIASHLFVSHNTVRTHTKHIFTKLDVTSRRGAISRARERGLL